VLAQRAAESLMLLNTQSGEYYTLDEVGIRVWELCDGTRSVDDIAAVISSEYEASPETIGADVRVLLADLAAERLVVRDEAGS